MKKIFYLLLIFPFLYSCSDEENEEEIRNEKIVQAIKAIDEYKEAYNFRDFKEKDNDFEDTNLYKGSIASIERHEVDLSEAMKSGNDRLVQEIQETISYEKQLIKNIKYNFTKPYYVVTFDIPRYNPDIQSYYIAALNKNFVFLGFFE